MKNNNLLKNILENFKNIKIGVVGDLMLDDYIIGVVNRISPEAPVPVVNVKEERFVLGGGANVAHNLSVLGANTVCFGVIGDDNNGQRLLDTLKSKNIDTFGIISSNTLPTIVKRRVLAGTQQLLRIDWEEAKPISNELENSIIERFNSKIDELDAVILSDYDKGILTPRVAQEIIKICKEKNKIITVDPKPKNVFNYVGASSITPNKKEAIECANFAKVNIGNTLEDSVKNLKEFLNLETILLTRSEEGMSLFVDEKPNNETTIFNIPTFAQEVYDVTGAGDTVISVFTLAAASGISWYEAAKIANTAAGVVVAKVGTSTATKEEILEFYNQIYERWECN